MGTNKTLSPSIIESLDVSKIFYLYNNYGYSYRKIADVLNKLQNTNKWSKGKIESILNNQTYTGRIVWNRRSRKRNPGMNLELIISDPIKNAAIIEDKQWEQSLKIRSNKSKHKDAKFYSTPFLLRDKLVCGICSKVMKTKNYGKDKYGRQRESIYRCATKGKDNRSELIIKKSFIEDKFIKELSKLFKFKHMDTLWVHYSSRIKHERKQVEKMVSKVDIEITKLKEKLDKIEFILDKESQKARDKTYIKMLNEALLTEKIKVSDEIEKYSFYKGQLNELQNSYFNDINDLKNELIDFFPYDFMNLENERKRMLIDILIREVIVKPTDRGIDLKIVLNSPIDKL